MALQIGKWGEVITFITLLLAVITPLVTVTGSWAHLVLIAKIR